MVKLKRKYESCIRLIPYFESKQDEERLKSYLGDDLFDQYMDVRKKLPNLSNQFKDFTKISFDTGNSDKDNETKKDLVNSYNRLLKYLPKDKQSLFKPLEGVSSTSLDESGLEEILNAYIEARDIVFKDQARFRDFGQLSKIPIEEIQGWIDTFSTNRAKKQQDKVEGADKLYEDSDWIVYRITTYPAAQLYGSNTKWCITGRYPGYEGRGEEYFNGYIRDNNLDGGYYFYLSKRDPSEKYCVLQRKDKTIHSIWDASDTNRGSSYAGLDVDLPEVKEVNLPKYSLDGFFSVIKKGKIYKVKEYLDNGYDPNVENNSDVSQDTPYSGETPLHIASEEGHKDIVELLLKHGADLNIKNRWGNTPLLMASYDMNKDMVEFLLNHGADPNVKNDSEKTPLHWASASGRKDIVELLLKHGADLNVKDAYGDMPLLRASVEGKKDIVELLLKHGANPNIKNDSEETPLHRASVKGYKDIVELLLKQGADPNIKNKYSETPLYLASEKGYKDIVELLLNHGSDPNIKRKYTESTPLHPASEKGYKEIVELLLKHGADPNVKDDWGNTPLSWAFYYNYKDIVELLKKYGAKE